MNMSIFLRPVFLMTVSVLVGTIGSYGEARVQPVCHEGKFSPGRDFYICTEDSITGPSRDSRPGDFAGRAFPEVPPSALAKTLACTAAASNGDVMAKTLVQNPITVAEVDAREENGASKEITVRVGQQQPECCHGFSARSTLRVRGVCSIEGLQDRDFQGAVAEVKDSSGSIGVVWLDCEFRPFRVRKRIVVSLKITCFRLADGTVSCAADGKLQRFLLQDSSEEITETKDFTAAESGIGKRHELKQEFEGTSHLEEDTRFLPLVALLSSGRAEARARVVDNGRAKAQVSAVFDPFRLTDRDEGISP